MILPTKRPISMLLVIDNYDSFTYNLVQYFGELGAQMKVVRNDELSVEEIRELNPSHLCISPGPCSPNEAGVSMEVVKELSGQIPIFGVCLGHQSIGQVFGGEVVRAEKLMHGKTSHIIHTGKSVFKEIQSPLVATRYHSLIVKRETLPECLEVTAETEDGLIMGLMHKELCVHGVQFHPESILTESGMHMLKNFLEMKI